MDQTLALIEAESKAKPGDSELEGSLHLGRGAVLAARHQLGLADAELKQCRLDGMTEWSTDQRERPEGDDFCVWKLASVQDALGQHGDADKTREILAHRLSRDPIALYIRFKAAGGLGSSASHTRGRP